MVWWGRLLNNNLNISRRQQSLTPGREVELFTFDASSIPTLDGTGVGGLYRFCSRAINGTTVLFGGNVYTGIGIEAEGFETAGKGRLPSPKLRISNIDLWASTLINSLGDPLGATITRFLTFDRYLDNGEQPDSAAIFLPQIFVIERKISQTREYVEFELSASMDQAGTFLPKRQILRDNCTHVYRRWNVSAGEFDYSSATCPYVGSDTIQGGAEDPYFDVDDESTTDPARDVCGKRLNSCKLRFESQGLPLPTRAFPGVARIRQRR